MADNAKQDDKQVVFLIGKSRGANHGDRRTVTKAEAERLVENGLARYPKGK